MLGDADADGSVGFGFNPFVGCGVFQICRVTHMVLLNDLPGAGSL
jgi:hypothetical protein